MKIELTNEQTDRVFLKEIKRMAIDANNRLGYFDDIPKIGTTAFDDWYADAALVAGCSAILKYIMYEPDAIAWLKENDIEEFA